MQQHTLVDLYGRHLDASAGIVITGFFTTTWCNFYVRVRLCQKYITFHIESQTKSSLGEEGKLLHP